MATASAKFTMRNTMAELLAQLGDIPPHRVLLQPTPGTATEQDVIDIHDRSNRLCELIDGTLVEKTMGLEESSYAVVLASYLAIFLGTHDLGKVFGADGSLRFFPGLVYIPDATFISWGRLPRTVLSPIPDLAVEILSKSNTKKEMDRKLRDYFASGVRLVWYVDPRKRTARVYTSPTRSTLLREDDHLDGGDVLPGFRISLREWFDEAGRTGPRP